MFLLHRTLIFFSVIIFASGALEYYYDHYKAYTDFKYIYWFFVTIGATFVLVLLRLNSVLKDIPRAFVVWISIYLCYLIINVLYSSQSDGAIDHLNAYLRSIGLLSALLVLFVFEKKSGIRTAQLAFLMVALFGVLMNVIDFLELTTMPLSHNRGRAAGFYQNANFSGKTLVFLMVASVPLLAKNLRFLYCIVVGFGVLITFSRGAWLLWALAMMGLASIGYIGFKRKVTSVIFVGGIVGIILYLLFTGGFVGIFDSLNLSDKLNRGTLSRLGESEASTLEHKTFVSRFNTLDVFWQKFKERPWFGHGLGYNKESGHTHDAHNTYLAIAVQGGLFGFVVLISLFPILWYNSDSYGRVLVTLLAADMLVQHLILISASFMLFLALIFAMGKSQRGVVAEYSARAGTPIPVRQKSTPPSLT